MRSSQYPDDHWGVQLLSVVSLVLIFFISISYIINGRAGILYNSDTVQLYLFAHDFWTDPGSFFLWSKSAALYSFPDWLIGGVLLLIPIPNNWLPLLYASIIMVLYCLAGGALLTSTGVVKFTLGSWLTAAMLIVGGLATLLFPDAISTGIYASLAAPYTHTGAVFSTILAAAIFLHALQRAKGAAIAIGALGLLTFVASFSDLLFCLWFVGPACITGLLYTWTTREFRGFLITSVIFVSAWAALAVQRIVHPVDFDGVATWSETSEVFTALLANMVRDDPPLLVIGAAALALLIRGALLTVRLFRRQMMPSAGELMEVLLAGIVAAALLGPLAAKMITDLGSLRYFLILMLVPLLWVGYHLLKFAADSLLRRFAFLVPLLLFIGCATIAMPSWSAAKRIVAPHPLQVCLEAHGRTDGLGEYWTAKELIFASDRRIHIAQIDRSGRLYLAGVNPRWFFTRSDTEAPLRPNFIIMKGLDPHRIRSRFGTPSRVIDCAGRTVWLYDAQLFPRQLKKRGFTEADRTEVGVLDGKALISTGRKGFLYYGPYAMVDAGLYDLIVYGAGGPSRTAWIDVASDNGETVHAKFNLPGSCGNELLRTLIKLDWPVADLEIRVRVGEKDVVLLTGFELRAR